MCLEDFPDINNSKVFILYSLLLIMHCTLNSIQGATISSGHVFKEAAMQPKSREIICDVTTRGRGGKKHSEKNRSLSAIIKLNSSEKREKISSETESSTKNALLFYPLRNRHITHFIVICCNAVKTSSQKIEFVY